MPARVLHISGIGEEPTIRLSNDHPPAPYATLSYCWGADQPAKTTRANFSSYLSDIVVSTLPPTVRDAAIVARGIGLSYRKQLSDKILTPLKKEPLLSVACASKVLSSCRL